VSSVDEVVLATARREDGYGGACGIFVVGMPSDRERSPVR